MKTVDLLKHSKQVVAVVGGRSRRQDRPTARVAWSLVWHVQEVLTAQG